DLAAKLLPVSLHLIAVHGFLLVLTIGAKPSVPRPENGQGEPNSGSAERVPEKKALTRKRLREVLRAAGCKEFLAQPIVTSYRLRSSDHFRGLDLPLTGHLSLSWWPPQRGGPT